MDLFSQLERNESERFARNPSDAYRTVHEPSVVLSQKQELAV